MANHVRRQLREAVAAACAGLPTTLANVYQSRVYPLQAIELPALAIYTTGEEVIDQTIGELIGRRVQIVIEGKAKAAADLDDTLDQIAKEVETAMAPPVTVGAQAIVIEYEGCQIEMEESDRPAGMIAMQFSAVLYTQRSTPDLIG